MRTRVRFDGRLEQEFVHHATGTGDNSVEKFFAYDHADRLDSTRYLVKKNSTEIKKDITLSANKYDALGQLKTKYLHSAANDGNYREQLDYCFTPSGWLSKVTGKTGGVENFGIELKYHNPENGAVAQYNGNIAEMLWKRGGDWVGYKFAYDGLGRLTNGEGVRGNTNRETISEYDKNGNIKRLQRAFDGTQKDDLTYYYIGNQLTKVADAENNSEGFDNGSSGAGDDYLYDGNGNATQDANRNIGTNGIAYSVHNLVHQVNITGGATLTYTYDGAGAKLRMANSNGGVNTKYAGAFEYNQGNYLTRIGTEEGQISITNNGNDFAFEYYLKDHLGNTRMVMNEAGTMTQETEYFPFGLAIPKITGTNKYLYNGKEKQPETGSLDYGARQYDPSIGRWMVVDPMAEKNHFEGGSVFVHNNPLKYIDPDGRDGVLVVFPDYKISTPIGKIGGLGHAGVLLIDNKTGVTKYYEYGRYDSEGKGLVRKVSVSNVVIGKDGKPTDASLNKVLGQISKKSGHGTRIEGAYIESDNFDAMRSYAEGKIQENSDPDRKPYSLTSNNCGTFGCDVLNQDPNVKSKAPVVIDPSPNSIIDEYQGTFGTVQYNPKTGGTKETVDRSRYQEVLDVMKSYFKQ